jgi:hypothetical protein
MNARMKDALDEALILSDKCDALFRSVVSVFIFFVELSKILSPLLSKRLERCIRLQKR